MESIPETVTKFIHAIEKLQSDFLPPFIKFSETFSVCGCGCRVPFAPATMHRTERP